MTFSLFKILMRFIFEGEGINLIFCYIHLLLKAELILIWLFNDIIDIDYIYWLILIIY